MTVSCVLLVSVLFLLTVLLESLSFASGIAYFVDSLVRFASLCAVFADSLVRIAIFCFWSAHFADSLVRFASLCAVFADSLVRIAFRRLWERSPRTSKTVPGLPEA